MGQQSRSHFKCHLNIGVFVIFRSAIQIWKLLTVVVKEELAKSRGLGKELKASGSGSVAEDKNIKHLYLNRIPMPLISQHNEAVGIVTKILLKRFFCCFSWHSRMLAATLPLPRSSCSPFRFLLRSSCQL